MPRICSSPPKDLRKTFATLLEIELGANGTALCFYLGHAGVGVRHQHYTARDIEFMRREVAERVAGWPGSGNPPLRLLAPTPALT